MSTRGNELLLQHYSFRLLSFGSDGRISSAVRPIRSCGSRLIYDRAPFLSLVVPSRSETEGSIRFLSGSRSDQDRAFVSLQTGRIDTAAFSPLLHSAAVPERRNFPALADCSSTCCPSSRTVYLNRPVDLGLHRPSP